MQVLNLKIKGVCPLLMHSDRFANPLDPATKAHKALTGKRKKTDEDHEAIARSEFFGGLYIDHDGPFIPSMNFEAALVEAAKMHKLGKHAKRALLVVEDKLHLEYDGPRDAQGLLDDPRFVDMRGVRVGQAKLMRCRPKFNEWRTTCQLAFNPEQITLQEVQQMVANAGSLVGIGDFRPRFGRFSATVEA